MIPSPNAVLNRLHANRGHSHCCPVRDKTDWKRPRISPTKAGVFCLPNYCPRCCWKLLRTKFQKPYWFPPAAILNKLDGHQKQLARIAIENGGLPAFFGDCSDGTEILPVTSLSCHHEETDLLLYGKPDFMVRRPKKRLGIVDGKTATEKAEDHPLFHCYKFQTNFYAYVAARVEEAYKVTDLGLLYFEFSPMDDDEILEAYTNKFMYARFAPKYVPVELDPDNIVEPVLVRIRELLDMAEAPKGRKDCPDCDLSEVMYNLNSDEDCTDGLYLLDRNERERAEARRKYLSGRDSVRMRNQLLAGLIYASSPDGVIRNWDWEDPEV